MSFVNKPLTDIMDCTRASTATYVDATGRIRTAGVNEPRVDYSSGQGRLLVEEARTNLVTWSEDFSQSAWGILDDTEIVSVFQESGVMVHRFRLPTGSNNRRVRQDFALDPSSVITMSAKVRLIEGDLDSLRLTIPSSNDSASVVIPIDEYGKWTTLLRSTTVTEINNSISFLRRTSSEGPDVIVDIMTPQLEVGSTPSSYIPTEASAVTRAADNVSRVLGDEFNPSEGTIVIDMLHSPNFAGLIKISDALTLADGLVIESLSSGTVRVRSRDSAGDYNEIIVGSVPIGSRFRVAVSYRSGEFLEGSLNGGEVISTSVAFEFEGSENLYLGNGGLDGSNRDARYLNNGIVLVKLMPRKVSSQELIQLTKV